VKLPRREARGFRFGNLWLLEKTGVTDYKAVGEAELNADAPVYLPAKIAMRFGVGSDFTFLRPQQEGTARQAGYRPPKAQDCGVCSRLLLAPAPWVQDREDANQQHILLAPKASAEYGKGCRAQAQASQAGLEGFAWECEINDRSLRKLAAMILRVKAKRKSRRTKALG
jgi:hypothetical protein